MAKASLKQLDHALKELEPTLERKEFIGKNGRLFLVYRSPKGGKGNYSCHAFLEHEVFIKLRDLSVEEFISQPEALRHQYFATLKWYRGEAQKVYMEGLTVGDRRAEDILGEL